MLHRFCRGCSNRAWEMGEGPFWKLLGNPHKALCKESKYGAYSLSHSCPWPPPRWPQENDLIKVRPLWGWRGQSLFICWRALSNLPTCCLVQRRCGCKKQKPTPIRQKGNRFQRHRGTQSQDRRQPGRTRQTTRAHGSSVSLPETTQPQSAYLSGTPFSCLCSIP